MVAELRLGLSSTGWSSMTVASVCAGGRISYFISPQAQDMVRAAVFYIVDEDNNGVGVGVFFSKSKAVTADHNLTASQLVGTQVVVQIPGNRFNVDAALSRCK